MVLYAPPQCSGKLNKIENAKKKLYLTLHWQTSRLIGSLIVPECTADMLSLYPTSQGKGLANNWWCQTYSEGTRETNSDPPLQNTSSHNNSSSKKCQTLFPQCRKSRKFTVFDIFLGGNEYAIHSKLVSEFCSKNATGEVWAKWVQCCIGTNICGFSKVKK